MSDDGKARILVVEDEEHIRRGLCDVLVYHGWAPTAVETGEDGLDQGLREPFDLAILDVMLPGLNGFDVCRRLREQVPRLAILMLTAKGSEDDVIHGLTCGADDYVTKPFSIRELVARVEALLRRVGRLGPKQEAFALGAWTVDPAAFQARDGDRTVELTPRETEILALFAREKGRVVSRRTLLREVWRMIHVDEIETRTVDVHVAKLRKKLDDDGNLIATVRGAGYRYSG